jgi:transposase InsO family protein
MYNDEIVSYDLALVANYNQIERMLDRAKLDDKSISNLIFHSDQGWQYQNPRYVETLKKYGIKQSMSRKGNCFDNAMMESFFGIMKNEIYYGHETDYKSFDEFQKVVNEYIDYYNNVRIKQKTAWLSPVQYRMMNDATIT